MVIETQLDLTKCGGGLCGLAGLVRDRFGIAIALRAQACEHAAADIEPTDVDHRAGRWDGKCHFVVFDQFV
jgi:hypothetical protein